MELLTRMSLSESTPSSNAVLQAILALSSSHRVGHHSQAAKLKIGALQALGASVDRLGMNEKEAMQHVAAGMLLCLFEVSTVIIKFLVLLLRTCATAPEPNRDIR